MNAKKEMVSASGGSMETVSGRISDDLYRWFVSLRIEGAVTNSDKLRHILGQLKRQHDGALDYVSALTWFRDVTTPLRLSLSKLEQSESMHSEVVSALVEHLAALAATLVSAQTQNKADAITLEENLVRRVFAMTEALLRQAITSDASAFDPKVVRRHSAAVVELSKLVK